MKISVIIPTYNEARAIRSTIQHLWQTADHRLLEVLVADGGSTDDTVGLAISAGAKVVPCTRTGRGPQMNTGTKAAAGDLLYFVHADTRPPESWIDDLAAATNKGDVIGNFQYRFDKDKFIFRFTELFNRMPWLFCQGGDKTLFISREVFFELGGFDEEHVIMEEYEFLRRARQSGYQWVTLSCKCVVSARKYERNSWLRVQVANVIVYNLWLWNFARPQQLKSLYWRLLN